MSRLSGRVALVTGSTRGIGRAVAAELAREGAIVVVNGRAADEAAAVAAELAHGATGVAADVAAEEGCERLVAATLEAHGRLDVLVNNAGASFASPAEDYPTAEWERMLALNLTAPFLLSKVAFPALRDGGGAIVNVASVAAFTTPPRRAGYVAAKAGLVALTKVLAAEWAPEIRVNAVVPGYIETDLVSDLLDRGVVDRALLEARTPTGRLGHPEEVARAVAYLASDDAAYVNGATLPVDGGWLVFGQNL